MFCLAGNVLDGRLIHENSFSNRLNLPIQPHNLKAVGSKPTPTTDYINKLVTFQQLFNCPAVAYAPEMQT